MTHPGQSDTLIVTGDLRGRMAALFSVLDPGKPVTRKEQLALLRLARAVFRQNTEPAPPRRGTWLPTCGWSGWVQ